MKTQIFEMKSGKKIINTGSRATFNKIKFKAGFEADYDEYKKVVKEMNQLRCQDILESEEGHLLPSGIGKLIILKEKPRVKKVYSMTRPGTRIYNLHSFGYIYRVYFKERLLLRYPELYRFRPHRANIKVPLYDIIVSSKRDYQKQSDFSGR
jgi:hypothetical protein